MNNLLAKLSDDKIKMNWNKNPITVDTLLGFLTVKLEESRTHGGYDMGWTRYNGPDGLIITGGMITHRLSPTEFKRVNYLNTIQYKCKLHNIYNNYVNPFFLFEIMNDEGKQFFINYYKEDIEKEIDSMKAKIEETEKSLALQKTNLKDIEADLRLIVVSCI
jgi:hypothetical protein